MVNVWITFMLLTAALVFAILAAYFNSGRLAGISAILLTVLLAITVLGK